MHTDEADINIHVDEEGDETCSNDRSINEFLKNFADFMSPIYISLFNIILDTGILPDSWLKGLIGPIYKRKSNPSGPENIRLIIILSCFSNCSLQYFI